MPAPYRRLGRIVKTHGTKGEVSVALRDGISSAFLEQAEVWVVPPLDSGAVARRVRGLRGTSGSPIVSITGIDSPADAHEAVGRYLLAPGEEAPAEEADSLVGFAVRDSVRGAIGSVEEIIHTGANDVLVVRGGPFGEVLVPVIDDVMERTDDADRVVYVSLLPGLIEDDES